MNSRRTFLRAGTILGAVLLALGGAELGVRLLGLGPSFQVLHRELFQLSANPVLGYELHPGAADGEATINSAGFRDREFARAKPPGVFRIVAVGDSVTFGKAKSPEGSWPKALERLLNERGGSTRFEVLNLGVTGYNALQIAERLHTLGLSYQPDLVLYGYVLNDPQEISIELEALRDIQDETERRFRAGLERGVLRILARSQLFVWLASRLDPPARPGRSELGLGPRRDPGYAAFRGGDERGDYFRGLHGDPDGRARLCASLERMAADVRAAGVPLVVTLFPLLLDPLDGPYPLRDVHALVADEARARGFDVVDLEAALAGCENCADDFLHPNARGAELAGRAVLAGLEELGRLPAR